jgi:hypothetical protein
MRKPLWLAMVLVATSLVAAVQAASQTSKPTPQTAKSTSPAASKSSPPTRVPAGSGYRIYDEDGWLVSNLKSGQASTLTGDCVQIACPPTFGKDIVCWVCRQRPEGSRGAGAKKVEKDRFHCSPPLEWRKGLGCVQPGIVK